MREKIFNIIKNDKVFLGLILGYFVIFVIFIIFIILNIHPSEIKVITRFSAFGTKNNYRGTWWTLYSLCGFGVLNFLGHILFAVKYYAKDRRFFARALLIIGMFILILAFFVSMLILKLAAIGI